MPPKARAVMGIEQFSLDAIHQHGNEAYAQVGGAILSLAQHSTLRERHDIAYIRDLFTRKSLALWGRRLPDGQHALSVSEWGENSYFMHDVRFASGEVDGFLRMYLFGNDTTVQGLQRAYHVIRFQDIEMLPDRATLQDMMDAFAHHPSKSAQIQTTSGISTFVRLARSIISKKP